ncbi:hypothetical protein SAMN05216506_106170 [Saccharopolyspora kobensis]|uniref:Uncharacterized protein n=1 Tax=Saccharopolyspora kobensis TaxID=146035 RepID=A0ABY1DYX9_9PSEU|nr:hypothetical protein SAMN05216506_106170 [Saccharopolyspora kobensis]
MTTALALDIAATALILLALLITCAVLYDP